MSEELGGGWTVEKVREEILEHVWAESDEENEPIVGCEQGEIDRVITLATQALREENRRLREVLGRAYAYIGEHRHGKAKEVLLGALELYTQPATPRTGGEG